MKNYFCNMNRSPIIFENIFVQLNSFITEKDYSKIFFFVDSNTHEFCLPLVLSELETLNSYEVIEIPPGEEFKVIEVVIQIWESLGELGATRKSLLINLGGGVITDMGGFIASTFKRGIDFINIPTTLLSMVDASIGGKTGIDLNGVKNQIGTFSFPEMTIIYPGFLHTLSDREFRSGLSEMLKHGLIYDAGHWKNLIMIENYDLDSISNLIKDSVNIKKKVTEKDPFEQDLRKILNFGHTIGHAVESNHLGSDHPYLHGEAISIGMLVESILSFENELINQDELDEIFNSITKIFGKNVIDEDMISSLLNWMKHDKKNKNNQINFSLLNGIGKSKFDIQLSEQQIIESILKYNRKLATL